MAAGFKCGHAAGFDSILGSILIPRFPIQAAYMVLDGLSQASVDICLGPIVKKEEFGENIGCVEICLDLSASLSVPPSPLIR